MQGKSRDVPSHKTSTTLLLATMMALVPALGSPREELLQDTLKSMLVALFALAAAMVFFWQLRSRGFFLKLHSVVWLPVLLMLYALGSTMWSHAYLGSVESIRWFIFSLILLLGMNSFTVSRLGFLSWGIHIGAVVASLWTALQFWFDFRFFAQGPNPASTFVNRNFFAEFVVCTLPFSVLLMSRLKDKASVFLITFSAAFNITTLLMTGTRSAILALGLLLPVLAFIVRLYRKQFASSGWSTGHWLSLGAMFFASIYLMGSIGTTNAILRSESTNTTPIARAFERVSSVVQSVEYSHGSFSMRTAMWKATGQMVRENPVLGVGAGAWEEQIPKYQGGGTTETDYYAHNEFLQLVAEYGLAGWFFLFGLFYYLTVAVYRTWTDKTKSGIRDAPARAVALSCLFALFIVSNAGFPWRLATTGAMFAISLSVLAASDLRLHAPGSASAIYLGWNTPRYWISQSLLVLCALLAMFIGYRAFECERKLVSAVKIATNIINSGKPNDDQWILAKAEMLTLTREGIGINPHYRKLTPIIADALASWGDWKNAIWIWESVLQSRPYVVGMLDNVARGYLQLGDFAKTEEYIQRARAVNPKDVNLQTLEVMLWSRTGKEIEAADRARVMLLDGVVNQDLIGAAYAVGLSTGNTALSILALETGIKSWPNRATDGWLRLGHIYWSAPVKDKKRAVQSFQAAIESAPYAYKDAVLARIPAELQSEMK